MVDSAITGPKQQGQAIMETFETMSQNKPFLF
jgi:hypothetical protein